MIGGEIPIAEVHRGVPGDLGHPLLVPRGIGRRDVVVVDGLDQEVLGLEPDTGDVAVVGPIAVVGADKRLPGSGVPRDIVVHDPVLVRVGRGAVVEDTEAIDIE